MSGLLEGLAARAPERVAALTKLRRHRLYARVFGTADGRRVLADLCRFHHVLGPCQTPEQEGERRVVIRILRGLAMTESEVTRLMRELTEEETP